MDVITENVATRESHLSEEQKISAAKILKNHYLFSQLEDEEIQRILEQIVLA